MKKLCNYFFNYSILNLCNYETVLLKIFLNLNDINRDMYRDFTKNLQYWMYLSIRKRIRIKIIKFK